MSNADGRGSKQAQRRHAETTRPRSLAPLKALGVRVGRIFQHSAGDREDIAMVGRIIEVAADKLSAVRNGQTELEALEVVFHAMLRIRRAPVSPRATPPGTIDFASARERILARRRGDRGWGL